MDRAELVKVLELIKPALATNNMVPIFQCFVFDGNGVHAYNDTIAIAGSTEFDVGGAVAIHGNTLLGLLSSSKVEEAIFTQKGQEITLTMGKSISKLPFQSSDSFIFSVPESTWTHRLPFTESTAVALKTCMDTVASDATQAGLLGVTLTGDSFYSCNGDSLTRVKLKKGIKGRVLLPEPFCAAILRLWAALEVTKAELTINDEWVHVNFGDWEVYGRVLEISDPIDFEELIKRNVKKATAAVVVPEGFNEALSRARVLADPESQKTVITVSKNKMSLFTETHMGDVRDTVLGLVGHPDVVAAVNASHLQRALRDCDQIAIHDNCVVLEKTPDVLMLVSNMS